MDIKLIAIGIFILVSIGILIFSLFKSVNKISYTSKDGTTFDNKFDLEVYEKIYDKLIPLFMEEDEKATAQPILGFNKSFLTKLKSDGFSDLKSLVKYRKQIKSLSDLINS